MKLFKLYLKIYSRIYLRICFGLCLGSLVAMSGILSEKSMAQTSQEIIKEIVVRGNGRVEKDAIFTVMKSQVGSPLQESLIQEDIKSLYALGYFNDLRIFKTKNEAGGVVVVVQVAERPAITSILFDGMNEVKEDDLKDKLETKIYTIVNEATINADLRIIEKQYADKGFYLSRVSYRLEKDGPNDVSLKFTVEEGKMVQVGEVVINGNTFFKDEELLQKMGSKPLTRSSAYGSSSLYKEDFVKNDVNIIGYLYRDQGFAEVQVGKPLQSMDPDRGFVRITFKVEEGLQYSVGSLDVSGDLLIPKEQLIESMKLKPGELFRYGRFTQDIEMLQDKYGDLGYAYADINPIVTYDKDKKLATINYEVAKGEKVYFGELIIIGNTKTRDNVMRREFEISDGSLYSGTGLNNSRKEMARLGFFEDVQVIKERSEKDQSVVDLKYKVKEKPTGQLNASIGYTPPQGDAASGAFGQGSYEEQNQNGMGNQTYVRLKYTDDKNYDLDLGFTNPRVNDGPWLAGANVRYANRNETRLKDIKVEEKEYGSSVFVGRKIIERVSARVTYQISKTEQQASRFLNKKFQDKGVKSSLILSVGRYDTNDNQSPTEGSEITLRQRFTGGPVLKGDSRFMETTLDGAYYYPVDFGESYRTNFRLYGNLSYIYPFYGTDVPFTERYRLGGFNDLRGYDFDEIGPRFILFNTPNGIAEEVPRGGDKKLFFQFEYFMPLIQEAGIRALLFADTGRVFDDNEALSFSKMKRDVGFGIRWQTPIAPFRFEYAYPIENGKLGEGVPIFSIGY